MASPAGEDRDLVQVWSASYAGVEVFQQLYNGTAVMRRRRDSYVNVTQILKCAQYDKPHRTRFLEREIHTGIHEKIQGGYGKYQGTWVPLDRAVALARRLGVFEALRSLLEYSPAPGEKPPTAPRSLESMHKRKLGGLGSPPSPLKRLATRTSTPAQQQKQQPQPQPPQPSPLQRRPGSLNAILNTSSGSENEPAPSGHRHYHRPPVAAAASSAAGSWAPGSSYHSPHPYGRRQPQTTPDSLRSERRLPGSSDSSRPPVPRMSAGRSPMPPYDGRHTPSSVASDGSTPSAASEHGWTALRDVSNTYHASQQGVGKGSSSLMTPPSSTARRTVGPGQRPPQALVTPTAKPSAQLPTPSSTLHSRPALSRAGAPLPEALVVLPSSQEGDVPSPTYSSQRQPPQSAPVVSSEPSTSNRYAQFVDLISRVRWQHEKLSAEMARYIRTSSAIDPKAVVGNSADGGSALHLAAQNAHWDVVQLLMDRGFDPQDANRRGLTPLMLVVCAPHAWRERATGVLDWLLDVLGSPPTLIRRDKKGRTALHWACVNSWGEPTEDWAQASLYYMQLMIRRLAQAGQTEVIRWKDYAGRSAEGLARASWLAGVTELLHRHSKHDYEPAITAGDIQPPMGSDKQGDRYDSFAARAASVIRRTAAVARSEHQSLQRRIDDDTRYAAKLLLELRTERDAASAEALGIEQISEEYKEADSREQVLRGKVEAAINLQQAARSARAVAIAEAAGSTNQPDDDSSAESLQAEYRRLRQSVESYESESRQLAKEYAELTSVVKPWPRPPALSLVDLFGEGSNDDDDDDLESGARPWSRLIGNGNGKTAADVADAEIADVQAINAMLRIEEERLGKFERVVSAACGDLPLDRVRTVVGPVLSVLNQGNTP
ncbi:Transcription factor mbp1 [Coemansia sp. RSA 552]|nr:Transcription factor mbp1 [Coemansia sp. RSA 552]